MTTLRDSIVACREAAVGSIYQHKEYLLNAARILEEVEKLANEEKDKTYSKDFERSEDINGRLNQYSFMKGRESIQSRLKQLLK